MARVYNDTLVPNGPQSLGANWTSEALSVEHIMQYSVQLVFTGSPVGAFLLDCSNDPTVSIDGPQNWTTVADSAQSVTEAGDHTWDVQNVGYNWVRVRYVYGSGSGSLIVARMNGKGV